MQETKLIARCFLNKINLYQIYRTNQLKILKPMCFLHTFALQNF